VNTIRNLLFIAVASTLVYNFVLARFLGLCPFIGVTRKTSNAIGMGMALTFVMTMAVFVTFLLYTYFLHYGPQNIFVRVWPRIFDYNSPFRGKTVDTMVLERVLRTGSYILVIAALVQLVELALKKVSPALYHALGIYLPLITTNCAVLGVACLTTTDATRPLTLIEATATGFFAGVGFTIAMLLMSGIRETLELADVPASLKGAPIAFICTSFMALSFFGFALKLPT